MKDPVLIKKIGDATALEVRATGIPYVFAPCIAVNKQYLNVLTTYNTYMCADITCSQLIHPQVCRDPRWGRCYESYSEDYRIVRTMTEIIPGLQGDIPANSVKGVPFVAGK
ncbi:hypothetical protein V8G54_027766 [Vigna mungo]|uniref:Uncharacterized protein n=1 Tax=Vigna mungo TaxID=3915 RepID=A0AAQ3MR67_VIGMU